MRVDNASANVLVAALSNSTEAGRRVAPESVDPIMKQGAAIHPEVKSENAAADAQMEKRSNTAEKEVIDAIENANKKLENANSHLQFSIHDKTKQIMVKVIDNQSNKVIKELPPEKILNMVANMLELAGILVDEHV